MEMENQNDDDNGFMSKFGWFVQSSAWRLVWFPLWLITAVAVGMLEGTEYEAVSSLIFSVLTIGLVVLYVISRK